MFTRHARAFLFATLVVVFVSSCATATPNLLPVPMATATPGCPPRPTRTVVLVPTFRDTPKPPTPAPPPTPGPPRIVTSVPVPTLVQPLATEEQVLKWVLDRDMVAAEWDDPWCLETPRLQPGRITVQWYPSMKAYDGSSSDVSTYTDPIWVVTIKGGRLHSHAWVSRQSRWRCLFRRPEDWTSFPNGRFATAVAAMQSILRR